MYDYSYGYAASSTSTVDPMPVSRKELCRAGHDHGRLPAAGVQSAKLKQKCWRKHTHGKQYDHKEPSCFVDDGYERFQSTGRGMNRHATHAVCQAKIDPTTSKAPAGASSRHIMSAEHTRLEQARPGDAWENNVGRPCRKMGGNNGKHRSVPIEFAAKLARGSCQKYNVPTDILCHKYDDANHKFDNKVNSKKIVRMMSEPRPFTFQPHDNNEPPPYQKTREQVAVIRGGKVERRLQICGGEDLAKPEVRRENSAHRHHIRTNDLRVMPACRFLPEWDQIDGTQPHLQKPNFNKSELMWGLMDRGDLDRDCREVVRSRSMEPTAGRRVSGITAWDKKHSKLDAARSVFTQIQAPPWALHDEGADDGESVAPSDSISQVSSKRSRSQEGTQRRTQSARGRYDHVDTGLGQGEDRRIESQATPLRSSRSDRDTTMTPLKSSRHNTVRRSRSARDPRGVSSPKSVCSSVTATSVQSQSRRGSSTWQVREDAPSGEYRVSL